jgi:hypothetical protein
MPSQLQRSKHSTAAAKVSKGRLATLMGLAANNEANMTPPDQVHGSTLSWWCSTDSFASSLVNAFFHSQCPVASVRSPSTA